MEADQSKWIQTDFNGLFEGGLLCLSHFDTCVDRSGTVIQLCAGMVVTAFDEDGDRNGNPDDIFATGTVIPAPDFAMCRGSKWFIEIDAEGIRHVSEIASGD